MQRVKFYSSTDMSIGFYMSRMKEIIESIQLCEKYGLLDVLEFFNILKYLNHSIYPIEISDTQVKEAKAILNRNISSFFISQSKGDILNHLEYFFSDDSISSEEVTGSLGNEDIDKYSKTQLREDFFECFEKYGLDQKIDETDLSIFIEDWKIPAWYFLETQFFLEKYPELIKRIFLNDTKNFEIFLSNYTADGKRYFIPKNIDQTELYKFCEDYIHSSSSNLNYIRLISQGIQGIQGLSIDAKLKLKARKRSELLEKEHFQTEDGSERNGFVQRIAVYTEKESYLNANENELKSLVDFDYIKKNPSPKSLLEYLMYLEHYFTGNWILDLCSFPNFESSTLVRVLSGVKTKKNYETSFYFSSKNELVLLSFKAFQDKLDEISGLRIEDLITFFFDSYCKDNFKIDWLPIAFANKGEKINIQTKNLFTVEEQVRKQWKLFVEEEKVDKELFELESTPTIGSLKSLIQKKYIYLNEKNEVIKKVLHLLFSDQSHLTYVKKELQANSFAQLIIKHQINYSFFNDFQKQNVDFLIENKIISTNDSGEIIIDSKQMLRISILSSLFKYGVIHYHNWIDKISRKDVLQIQQVEIDAMIEEGMVRYENTLFAKPEAEYLDYILNNSQFDNAVGIRNKYLHGSMIEDNYRDMLYALVILVAYVIKINEELELNEKYS